MNKTGQMGLVIIVAIMIFVIGMMSINFIKDEVTRARDATSLDCSNSDISDASKLTCLAVDLVVPYFIVVIFSLAGAGIVARLTL